ncbi:hypothetical protein CEXT_244651 [Caerostris extrusa]|uniref:Uncharacterized protein n=1 Tax=Caerostris extrusa TaxID=172846 RepID=A0AAV4N9D9_CAEEX|nr:hypothetical protein CEXT_244651 [Caerostris extrusa]
MGRSKLKSGQSNKLSENIIAACPDLKEKAAANHWRLLEIQNIYDHVSRYTYASHATNRCRSKSRIQLFSKSMPCEPIIRNLMTTFSRERGDANKRCIVAGRLLFGRVLEQFLLRRWYHRISTESYSHRQNLILECLSGP